MKKRYKLLLFIISVFIALHLFGYRISYIVTESMSPALMPGDLVISKSIQTDKVSIGDIIIFDSDHHAICHRVVDISVSHIITKGDANLTKDPPIITKSSHNRLQLVCKRIPCLGYPFAFLQNRAFQVSLIVSLMICFLIKNTLGKKESKWTI